VNFGPVQQSIAASLASWGIPQAGSEPIALLILLLIPFGVAFSIAGVAQYFERKVSAIVSRRYGPSTAGGEGVLRLVVGLAFFFLPATSRASIEKTVAGLPGVKQLLRFVSYFGLGQIVADGVKMFTKEDIVPRDADRFLFRASTYLVMLASFVALAALPISQNFYLTDFSVAAIYTTSVTGLVVVGLLLAGWGSNNKWSLLGGVRAVAQIVSYEIPVALCIAAVAMWSGTLSFQGMIAAQYQPGAFSFLGWNLFQSPFFFILSFVYFTAGMAECNRTPFDMAESESELVAGYGTEYSGLRWGLFFISEYTDMILVGGIYAALFLGGYQSPFFEEAIVALPPVWEALVHGAIFCLKFLAAIGVMMWLRWTLPRFRIDQVMRLAWVRLIPLSLICLFLLAASMLWFGQAGVESVAYGRFVSSPVVQPHWWQSVSVWVVTFGIVAVLVVLAKKYGEPRPMPSDVHKTLVGGEG
jgi:NADH-quinone oxidoreductase subunit H